MVVHVAVAPGVVIRLAAWMLDSAVCARMTFGAPCISVSALTELHQLLTERGFRQSSWAIRPSSGSSNMSNLPKPPLSSAAPRQLSIPFASARLRGMDPSERRTVLVRLASVLLEAASPATAEGDDDER